MEQNCESNPNDGYPDDYLETLKCNDVWAYCDSCRTINKNPSIGYAEKSTRRFQCPICMKLTSFNITVPKEEAPPEWFLDQIGNKR